MRKVRVVAGTVALATGLSGLVGGIVVAPAVAAPLNECVADDNGLPQVGVPTFSPSAVDVSDGPATVTVRIPITDTGGPGPASGVARAHVEIGPSWPRGPYGKRLTLRRESPNTWVTRLVVPRHAPGGALSVSRLHVVDRAGNGVEKLDEPPSGDPVFDPALIVESATPDTSVPEVASITAQPRRIDTRRRARTVRIRVRATDDLSGVASADLVAWRGAQLLPVTLVRRGAALRGRLRLPRGSRPGRWKLGSLRITDQVGNQASLEHRALRRLGRATFRVRSTRDRARPRLRGLSVSPPKVNVRRKGARIRFRARLTDRGVGVASAWVAVANRAVPLRRVRGSARRGVWRGTMRLGTCDRRVGPLRQHLMLVATDRVGNEAELLPRRMRIASRDLWPPGIELRPHRELPVLGPVTLRFDEPVEGLTEESATVRKLRWPVPGPVLDGTWTCRDRQRQLVSCATGKVRLASWVPAAALEPNTTYDVTLNPEGTLLLTDRAGNPYRRKALSFFTR